MPKGQDLTGLVPNSALTARDADTYWKLLGHIQLSQFFIQFDLCRTGNGSNSWLSAGSKGSPHEWLGAHFRRAKLKEPPIARSIPTRQAVSTSSEPSSPHYANAHHWPPSLFLTL